MRTGNKTNRMASVLAIAIAACAQPARAQAPNAGDGQAEAVAAQQGGNEEIIVTATRREERLQDVPIAVTAFSDETISDLSASTVGDLAAFTPNLARTSGPTGGNDAFFFIRGIGQVDSNPAADPGVGVYVDGIYYGRVQGSSIDTDDVARVEVLRGPQGTLFGRNTIGGAINITTKDPGRDPGLEGRVTVGSRERIDAFAAADLPVTADFRVRISGATRNQDGFARNVYSGAKLGEIENLSGRVKAVWEPAPSDIRVTLMAEAAQGRGTSAQTVLVGFNPAGGPIPGATPLGVPLPPDLLADTSSDPYVSFTSIDPINRLDTWGVGGDVTIGLGGATRLKVIVAYRDLEQFVANDFDGTGYRLYDNFFDTATDQLSVEIQLSGEAMGDRLTWLVGLYGFKEDISHNNRICLGTNLSGPFAFARNAGGCIENNQRFTLDVESYAAFAHTTFAITDQLSLVAGLRYTEERKDQSFDFFLDNTAGVFSFFGFPPIILPTLSPNNPFLTIPTDYSGKWNKLTPKVGLEYKPNDDVLLYASYSQGFKSGGFNGRPSPNATGGFNAIQAYDPETLDAYEVGFKTDLANNRLRVNGAAFYSIYDGIQLLVLDPGTGFFNTENAGRNELWGFELEVTARPVEPATVYFNLGYIHDEYTSINPLSGIGINNQLPVTPEWSLAGGASYRFGLGSAGSLELRADASFRDEVFYGATNNPLEYEDQILLVNARATWTHPNERFSVAAYGVNVFDKTYYANAQDVRGPLGVAFAQVAPPAEYGVEARFRF